MTTDLTTDSTNGPTKTPALRPATPQDEPRLRALFEEAKRATMPGLDDATLAPLLSLQYAARNRQYAGVFPDALDLVIEVEGVVAGRIVVDVRDHDVHVIDLVVAEEFRGRGLATGVLRHWLTVADELGATATLHVAFGNPAAKLYARLGFEQAGVDSVGAILRRPLREDLRDD